MRRGKDDNNGGRGTERGKGWRRRRRVARRRGNGEDEGVLCVGESRRPIVADARREQIDRSHAERVEEGRC